MDECGFKLIMTVGKTGSIKRITFIWDNGS